MPNSVYFTVECGIKSIYASYNYAAKDILQKKDIYCDGGKNNIVLLEKPLLKYPREVLNL